MAGLVPLQNITLSFHIWLIRIDPDGRLSLVEYIDNKPIPPYGILSHTWLLAKDEVTFKDMQEHRGSEKKGYAKITFCVEQAQRNGLKFFWVDTCCINKTSSADLSEAINSMYTWYRKSSRCYVYLSDVCNDTSEGVDKDARRWKTAFKNSR
ncbi:hypothetical protein HBI56_144070 [Parastagonospora nodorum]|uniref:Heterokaryon incompatibility domain-containing protein n=1 Tax=Phaeosphaeria nodorum (strain SN15 / ATCC MYA-4574 / FGSC 10173) TaxID=321614 RepID=A0A7U2I5M8_PHANO|nr:hypothetical protein HBI10_083450 [Parastagonospora nodorum]QRD00273.1 hypothetical protein JI435_438110 [Parastagonospora nodorum SN15]KAH4039906.1 hypothetical protein HBI09_038460 [Parastagonospora nodorum]KAH4075917.1 hypothetical protein HBH50_023470 [Parastagonospora nodorum]KAH4244267.1 hypothetical protein HBI06_010040 [Parastagonospora nodorum]